MCTECPASQPDNCTGCKQYSGYTTHRVNSTPKCPPVIGKYEDALLGETTHSKLNECGTNYVAVHSLNYLNGNTVRMYIDN